MTCRRLHANPGARYPGRVIDVTWDPERPAAEQLGGLETHLTTPGLVVLRFPPGSAGESLSWGAVEPLTRSRAVTVAEVRGKLSSPALDVALCCDLVCARPAAILDLPPGSRVPPAAVIWAAGRAGPAALARVLLDPQSVLPADAFRLGLVHELLNDDEPLTAARDLIRSQGSTGPRRALELATFRFLFAVGDPREGARAFVEHREPRF